MKCGVKPSSSGVHCQPSGSSAAWDWRQPNGAFRDMVCRGMLLMLDRAGQIVLPPVSYVRHNPLAKRARPAPMLLETTPIMDRLRHLQPLEFQQVRCTSDEPLFNGSMEEYHYLRTFLTNTVTCWRHWGRCTAMMPKRANAG